MRRLALLMVGMIAAAASATAQEGGARRLPFTPGPPVELPPCTCRAAGQDWRIGQTVCLKTTGGERLAICTTDENVTTWRISEVPCATSSLPFRSTAWLTQRNLR